MLGFLPDSPLPSLLSSGGNWKMNGTIESGKKLVETIKSAKLDPSVGE